MKDNQINDHSTNTANYINKTTTIGMLYTNKKENQLYVPVNDH